MASSNDARRFHRHPHLTSPSRGRNLLAAGRFPRSSDRRAWRRSPASLRSAISRAAARVGGIGGVGAQFLDRGAFLGRDLVLGHPAAALDQFFRVALAFATISSASACARSSIAAASSAASAFA